MLKKYTINPVFDMETLEWVSNDGVVYEDDSCEQKFCGPSSAETSIAAGQQSLASSLNSDFNSRFGSQTDVLNNLTSSLNPLLSQGPNQQGFNAQTQAALTTQALDQSGAEAANLSRAVGNSFAGRGGGSSSGLISGIETQAKEQGAAQAENQLNTTLSNNTLANYNLGNQNWRTALGASEEVAGLENPSSLGQTAVGAGSSAYQEANENANQTAQQLAEIAGAGTALAGKVAGGIGNLDMTGGSTAGEQIGNFFGA
jgi:hypothetical protein